MLITLTLVSFLLFCLNGRARRHVIGFDFTMRYEGGGVAAPKMALHFALLAGFAVMLGRDNEPEAALLLFLSILAGVTSLAIYLQLGPDRREWYEYGFGRFVLGGLGYLALAVLMLVTWIPFILIEFRQIGDSDEPEPIGTALAPVMWATVMPPVSAVTMLAAAFCVPLRDHLQCMTD